MIGKVEVGTLDMGELFEHRGVIYEVLYKRIIVFVANTLTTNIVTGIYGNIYIPNLVYGQKLINYQLLTSLWSEGLKSPG